MLEFVERLKTAKAAKAQTSEEKYFELLQRAIKSGDLDDNDGVRLASLSKEIGRDFDSDLKIAIEYAQAIPIYADGVSRRKEHVRLYDIWSNFIAKERTQLEQQIQAKEKQLHIDRQKAAARVDESRAAFEKMETLRAANDSRLFATFPELERSALLDPAFNLDAE